MADLTIYLLILIAAFIGIVIWVFGRKRKGPLREGRQDPVRRREKLRVTDLGLLAVSATSWALEAARASTT